MVLFHSYHKFINISSSLAALIEYHSVERVALMNLNAESQYCQQMFQNFIQHSIDLLAPTGALIVTVVYYIYIEPQPLFEILSISANIFSFSF